MRKSILHKNQFASAISITLLATALFTFLLQDSHKKTTKNKDRFTPTDWQFRQRAFPTGKINKQAYLDALSEKSEMKASTEGYEWQFHGPTNIGGRITDIELANGLIYVAGASGGIFTSENGTNWQPIFDNALTLSIGDMAVAPTNEQTIYVGTGEANAGGGSLAYDGVGVYKTTDAGDTWNHIGLPEVGSIGKVIVDPKDENTCYVGAMGRLFENNSERGLYKTVDGGTTWQQSLFITDSTGIIDMAIHPLNTDTLYAASWERVRRIDRRSYSGPSSGIYRTTDGGETWTELTNGLPSTAGRIGICISESSPNILYAVYSEAETDYIGGVYKSEDHGETWVEKSIDGLSNVPYFWWFGKIYADPTNPDIVYITSLEMHKSTNGANSWTTIFLSAHVDMHALAFDKEDPEHIYLGHDGGLDISNNGGISSNKANGLPITQFYTCEIDYSYPERLYGGTQDNSPMRTMTGNENDWEIIYGGDGFYTLVDPTDNTYIYTEYQYGNFVRSTDGGNTFTYAMNGISSGDRKNWNTPVVFNPSNPEELFYGANRLYKTANRAESWEAISPDLTDGSGTGNLTYGTITCISVSAVNDDIIMVGTDDGNISITSDGGTNWENISEELPKRWVTSVATSKNDENTIYATLSGFRLGVNQGHIYKSTDFGITWVGITGDLPDIPVNDFVQICDSQYIIATDVGIFETKNEGVNWIPVGNNLPELIFTDLDFHQPTLKIAAASFGRGMFSATIDTTQIADTTSIITPITHIPNAIAYPNPTTHNTTIAARLKQGGKYCIKIYNAIGGLEKTTWKGFLPAGEQKIEVDLSDIPHGHYIIHLENANKTLEATVKIIKNE